MMNWRAILLFAGTALLLVASVGIVLGRSRPTDVIGQTDPPTVRAVGTLAATTTSPTVAAPPPATAATSPTLAATPPASARTAATSAVRPTSPPAATATRGQPSATPGLPTVTNGGCAMSLPPGYGIESGQSGYYPANDRTGFVALDSFATSGGQTPEALAQGFATRTLDHALADYQQISAANLGDRYRIDYSATANGQPGQGSIYVQIFGTVGCGVTIFALDTAPGSLVTTLEVLVGSLGPLPTTRSGSPTPVR